ncbi:MULTISPECIES: DEAD/DEAH box helicase [Novosphingobium]|uniref:ATP-dependent RNA helicase DeaD n=1 Tax=Novosphingobium mathurense TaxID=428990 RepID=A0A1U6GYQ7_9SPHN|nr:MULTISPECIES: DEAD/DEAH box helicase [Novosphingobium]CDO38233.1 DEAD/DEAH box helicase-like protein [Novosphingobium sp. KN65.2]SLJ88672.1 ATP-dependent RNA helicase DeaD [Novosphingobium mathurense]
MTFTRVPQPLAEALEAHGYESLTAVQSAVVEAEAQGRDLVVSAQTGSGKTVAFGLAMADELLAGEGITSPGAPLALVIAPTRELALQVSRELTWLYARTGARIVTCVGGMDPVRERKQLEHGATIVVGTPGRLRDHLERGKLDLEQLRVAILDEADEMLDMGFREDLEEILDATAKNRRTLLFSATMPKPIEALARRYQQNSLRISTMSESRGHGDISYQAVTVAPADIERVVVNLLRLHEAETAILFCATRDNVRHLHATLTERGFSAVALSGEHSQNERNNALQALRDRRARVCVATDVAARGIDLPSLSLVIHVEIPRDAETLQHRSGRTGRAGKKGTAVIVVPFPRRRRVETMLRGARVQAEWIEAPTPEQIRRNDRERLIEQIMQPVEFDEEDREIAKDLLAKTSAEELAAALVRSFRERMPQPEELIGSSADAQQKRQRPGFDDVVWFRMDIGKRQNADPRWILPLLCRRGHVTRNAVGAIRISANETYFQIPSEQADQFSKSVARTAREGADDESGVLIELAPDTPRDVAKGRRREEGAPRRHPRGEGGPPRGEGKRYQPRPTGHKAGGPGQFGKKPRKDRRGD